MATNEIEKNETDSSVFIRRTNENEFHDASRMFSKVGFPSCRLVLLIMGFLGCVNVYCLRVNLGVALVAMVNHTQQAYSNISHNYSHNNNGDICVSSASVEETAFDKDGTRSGEFNWDSNTQGTILAAFFYGYITTQVRMLGEKSLLRINIFSW